MDFIKLLKWSCPRAGQRSSTPGIRVNLCHGHGLEIGGEPVVSRGSVPVRFEWGRRRRNAVRPSPIATPVSTVPIVRHRRATTATLVRGVRTVSPPRPRPTRPIANFGPHRNRTRDSPRPRAAPTMGPHRHRLQALQRGNDRSERAKRTGSPPSPAAGTCPAPSCRHARRNSSRFVATAAGAFHADRRW